MFGAASRASATAFTSVVAGGRPERAEAAVGSGLSAWMQPCASWSAEARSKQRASRSAAGALSIVSRSWRKPASADEADDRVGHQRPAAARPAHRGRPPAAPRRTRDTPAPFADAMRSTSLHEKPATVRSPATALRAADGSHGDVERRGRAGDPDFARRRRHRVGERLIERAGRHAQVGDARAVEPAAQRVGQHAERQDVGRVGERRRSRLPTRRLAGAHALEQRVEDAAWTTPSHHLRRRASPAPARRGRRARSPPAGACCAPRRRNPPARAAAARRWPRRRGRPG